MPIAQKWRLLTSVAAGIVVTATTFMLKVPGLYSGDTTGDGFASFYVAILSALYIWLAWRTKAAGRKRIAMVTGASLACVVLLFFSYHSLLAKWTVTPSGVSRPLITGTILTDAATKFAKAHAITLAPLSMDDASRLLENGCYESEMVWSAGLQTRWTVLLAHYVILISGVCWCIVGAVYLIPERPIAGG